MGMARGRILVTVGQLFAGALLACVGGCSSGTTYQVSIVPEPADSSVSVRKGSTRPTHEGVGPTLARLSFRDSEEYAVDVAPSDARQDEFRGRVERLSEARVRGLPTANGVRELRVALEQREFITLPDVVVFLDPQLGPSIRVAPSRSYKNESEEGGRPAARVVDLGKGLGIRGFSMSPDGSRIVYAVAQSAGMSDLDEFIRSGSSQTIRLDQSNIRAAVLTTRGIEQLTTDTFIDSDPAFSADGKHILMASNRRRTKSADLLRVSAVARSGGIQDIYLDTRGGRISNVSEGRNGLIAFCIYPSEWESPDQAQVWTLGGPSQFPTQLVNGTDPCVSPDGTKIAFISEGDLYSVNTDGTSKTQLTSNASALRADYEAYLKSDSASELERVNYTSNRKLFTPNSTPSWSPDGKSIVFTSLRPDADRRPQEDIYMVSVDGGSPEQLTTNRSSDRSPVVSPDGSLLYFISNRGGQWAIWRIPLGGAR